MKILFTSFLLLCINYSLFAQFDPPQVIDPDVFGITKIVAADVNNDGFKDLITSQKYHNNDKISVFFNTGEESFGEQLILTTNIDTPEGVAAGDLNQDGWNDIAGISLVANSLYWFPNADGNFPNEIPLDTGLVHPEDIEIVDIDNDGKPDIVVLDHTNIIVYYNLGNGNFNKITTPNDDFEYYAFSIADIDGDGFKDIIIGSGQVLVYMNNNGLFTTHDIARSNSIANNGFCFMISTADLDGNNSMDLIIDGNSNSEISWYANDGNGFFSYTEAVENTLQCQAVTTADMNEDGSLDIVAALFQEGEIVWYANDGFGDFSEKRLICNGTPASTIVATNADLNNDGMYDLIWSHPFSFNLNRNPVGIRNKPNTAKLSGFTVQQSAEQSMVIIKAQTTASLSIFDIQGHCIAENLTLEAGTNTLNLPLKSKLYLFRFSTATDTYIKKILLK